MKSRPEAPQLPADGPWRAVWDEGSNDYYFWNMQTNETSWDNPVDADISAKTEDAEEKDTRDEPSVEKSDHEDTDIVNENSTRKRPIEEEEEPEEEQATEPTTTEDQPPPAIEYQDYTVQGHFNRRTGKFESDPALHHPEQHSVAAKSTRQLGAFFDFDTWAEERGRKYIDGLAEMEEAEKRRKPTKAEMRRYRSKKAKKQAEKRKWLFED